MGSIFAKILKLVFFAQAFPRQDIVLFNRKESLNAYFQATKSESRQNFFR